MHHLRDQLEISNNLLQVDLHDQASLSEALNTITDCVSNVETCHQHLIVDKALEASYFSFYFLDAKTQQPIDNVEGPKQPSCGGYQTNESLFFEACVKHQHLRAKVNTYLLQLVAIRNLTQWLTADSSDQPSGLHAALALCKADSQYLALLPFFVDFYDQPSHADALIQSQGMTEELLFICFNDLFDKARYRESLLCFFKQAPNYEVVTTAQPELICRVVERVCHNKDASVLSKELNKVHRLFLADDINLEPTFKTYFSLDDGALTFKKKLSPNDPGFFDQPHHILLAEDIGSEATLNEALQKMIETLQIKSRLAVAQEHGHLIWHFYTRENGTIVKINNGDYDEEAFFKSAVAYPSLHQSMLYYGSQFIRHVEVRGKPERNSDAMHSIHCDHDAEGGSLALLQLALSDITYLPYYMRLLRTVDVEHTVGSHEHVCCLLTRYNLCPETAELLAVAIAAVGLFWDGLEYIESEYDLSGYLNSSKARAEHFALCIRENYSTHGRDASEAACCLDGLKDSALRKRLEKLIINLPPATNILKDKAIDLSHVVVAQENWVTPDPSDAFKLFHHALSINIDDSEYCSSTHALHFIDKASPQHYQVVDLHTGKPSITETYETAIEQLTVTDDAKLKGVLKATSSQETSVVLKNQSSILFEKTGQITCLLLSPNGRWFVYVDSAESGDDIINVIDCHSAKCISQIETDSDSEYLVLTFSPDSQYLLYSNNDWTCLYATHDWELVDRINNSFYGPKIVACHPTNQLFASVSADRGANYIILYSPADFANQLFVKGEATDEDQVQAMAYTPDGSYLMVAGFYEGSAQVDFYTISAANSDAGFVDTDLSHDFTLKVGLSRLAGMHVCHSKNQLITCSETGQVSVYDIEAILTHIQQNLNTPKEKDQLYAIARQSTVLTVWDQTVGYRSISSHATETYLANDSVIYKLDVAPLAVRKITEVGSAEWDFLRDIQCFNNVYWTAISREEQVVVYRTLGWSKREVWSYESETREVILLPEKSLIVLAVEQSDCDDDSEEKGALLVFNYLTGEKVFVDTHIHKDLNSLILSPDRKTLVGCHYQSFRSDCSGVYFWNTDTWLQSRAAPIRFNEYFGGDCLAFNAKGNHVAVADGSSIMIVDTATGKTLQHYHADERYDADIIVWSPCEQYILIAASDELRIYSIATNQILYDRVYHIAMKKLLMSNGILSLAFSRDGLWLLVTTNDEVRQFDWKNLLARNSINSHEAIFISSLKDLEIVNWHRVFVVMLYAISYIPVAVIKLLSWVAKSILFIFLRTFFFTYFLLIKPHRSIRLQREKGTPPPYEDQHSVMEGSCALLTSNEGGKNSFIKLNEQGITLAKQIEGALDQVHRDLDTEQCQDYLYIPHTDIKEVVIQGDLVQVLTKKNKNHHFMTEVNESIELVTSALEKQGYGLTKTEQGSRVLLGLLIAVYVVFKILFWPMIVQFSLPIIMASIALTTNMLTLLCYRIIWPLTTSVYQYSKNTIKK